MRGNPAPAQTGIDAGGSIPAYAGEPSPGYATTPSRKVYPRVCGGTHAGRGEVQSGQGLSPRMRGNPPYAPFRLLTARSIPAYAGEPDTWKAQSQGCWVYPRVCGGTPSCPRCHRSAPGLSPRMRGNPRGRSSPAPPARSIPAYAGEPRTGRYRHPAGRVYPRVCGGTKPGGNGQQRRNGLSPRMRGNHRPQLAGRLHPRSIPAYAGEPRR